MLCSGVGWVGWLQVFSGSMVPLALGLYTVAVWHGSLIDDGPRDIFAIYWGSKEHLLAWGELWESMSSMGLVEFCALCLFVGEEAVSHSLHVHWLARSTWALDCPVVQDLMGQRHVEPHWG